jgi:hypothetical protein
MSIECYKSECPRHNKTEPFCDERECILNHLNPEKNKMMTYTLFLTKEELHELAKDEKIIIKDKIETGCDNCGEDIELEIQLWVKE